MGEPSVSPSVTPPSPSPGHKMAFQGQLLLSQCWCQRLWKTLFAGSAMPRSSQPGRLQLHAGGRGRNPRERTPFLKILFPFHFSALPQPCPSRPPPIMSCCLVQH